MMETKQAVDLSARDIGHKVHLSIGGREAVYTDVLAGFEASAEVIEVSRMGEEIPRYMIGRTKVVLSLLNGGSVLVGPRQELEVY